MNRKRITEAQKVCAAILHHDDLLYQEKMVTYRQLGYAGCAMYPAAMISSLAGAPWIMTVAFNAFSAIAVWSAVGYHWWQRGQSRRRRDAAIKVMTDVVWEEMERALLLEEHQG